MDFDTIIDRRDSASNKWDKYAERDIIPMWVADMDFRSPPQVLRALHERVEHGVFGYSHAPDALIDVVISRLAQDYGWRIEPEWLVWVPGIVCGLHVISRAVGEDNDEILTTVPVYHHLFQAPPHVRRRAVSVPLVQEGERWRMDFDAIEAAITPRTCMLMLCNPHNPVGRVYTREELLELAVLCEKHNLVIGADEIHCQLILDRDKHHIPMAALDPAIADRTITLMAASKTYNLPGLGCAFAIISNERLRQRFVSAKTGIVPHVNVLGYIATLAAFRDSDEWLAALLDYLRANRELLLETIPRIPGLSISPIEATYLAWIDCRETGLDDPAAFFEQAGVGFSPGSQFQGDGFVRLNFGCPRSVLQEALARMQRALASR